MKPALLLIASLTLFAQTTFRTTEENTIFKAINNLRSLSDTERPAATRNLALQIRDLPKAAQRAALAGTLAMLSTEGDPGQNTLQEVATTLAAALQDQPAPSNPQGEPAPPYFTLAQLVRYEHVHVDFKAAPYLAALAQLEAADRKRQSLNFALTDLKGARWELNALKGKVVLVNFWATWCPPCRKEMPDLEKLSKRFAGQLVILAISDEERRVVEPFLKDNPYTYPVLLDPGRTVHTAFEVDGIPKTFIYDRSGKLAAQSIDMRTERQFLELLAQAGLK